jgi:hypothetical protein
MFLGPRLPPPAAVPSFVGQATILFGLAKATKGPKFPPLYWKKRRRILNYRWTIASAGASSMPHAGLNAADD